MTKVGVYAGTFDPVHNGHLAFALAAIERCGLERVVFLPEPKPRGKHNVTNVHQRAEMLRLAVADPRLQVHILPNEQFSVAKTLPLLQQRFGTDLTLLVGSDVAQHLPNWSGVQAVYDTMHIAVGLRQGDPAPVLPVAATIIPTMHAHVAASHIRSGQSQDIAPRIREYIERNHLYGV